MIADAADVAARAAIGGTTWLVVVAARDDLDQPTGYRILRERGGELLIAPPGPAGAARRAAFDRVASFEVRALGGAEVAVLVVSWTRDLVQPLDGEGEDGEGLYLATLEEGDQLYLIRAAPDGTLAVGFTHLLGYRSQTDAPEEVDLPRAGVERIRYRHAIVAGEPLVLRLARTQHQRADGDRLAGVLEPDDPLFAAGEGLDVAIA